MISLNANSLPLAADVARAHDLRTEWLASADAHTESVQAFIRDAASTPEWMRLLDAIFGNSPYLTKLLFDHSSVLAEFAKDGPDAVLECTVRDILAAEHSDAASAMRFLRLAKARVALLIALADMSGIWTVDEVIAALSRFADACVKSAVRAILTWAERSGSIGLQDPRNPEIGCGYVVLAVGKLGGRELNYSSDIDLFVFYDDERLAYKGTKSPQEFAVQITKELVRLLQERTGAGYVFRTDLRLRPDPGSTAIAVSREAAQIYYESAGQNWERAALIKARYIAGDEAVAAEFLQDLQPFIWRKSLDFYAIQDIHSIKRQIYANKGGGKVNVRGHNIKLGRGGIREIEFFAQVQQLIWGGRFPEARVSQTLKALDVLVNLNFTTSEIRHDLAGAYRYLRKLEHRLQMIADQQTQTLPTSQADLARVGAFMGSDDPVVFMTEVENVLRLVETHYAGLFEDAPSLAVDGNLVFTGTEDDPDTIATLRRLGYQDPSQVAQMVRGWHHGRYRATRSNRARQLLTEVMPSLLTAFGKTAQPNAALIRFDTCLSGLPAGVPILSVFHANPELLDLVAEIMGDAPRLAEHLTRSPALLDYVLEPEFYQKPDSLDVLKEDLKRAVATAEAFDLMLDLCRRWVNDQQFRVGVHILRGILDPSIATDYLTDIAEAVITTLVPLVEKEFSRQFGTVPGGQLAIVGYGKLGSREITPSSDLDLVVIYDSALDAYSQGASKSLPAPAYYIRLAQRIVTAFTMMTQEGKLYPVDMRLRPSGDKGPLACSLEAFVKYQMHDAWTWEHMALTRARVVYGEQKLRAAIEKGIAAVLSRPREPNALVVAVADMRARMRREQTEYGLWDIKRREGGIIDIEFILQYLLLAQRAGMASDTRPAAIIASLIAKGALTPKNGEDLAAGIKLWSRLQVMLRVAFEGEAAKADIPLGLQRKLAAAVGVADFSACEHLMDQTAHAISALFQRLIAAPAAQARPDFGDQLPH